MSQTCGPPAESAAENGRVPRGPYRKSSETRRRVVAAAAEVFAENGFLTGSTAQIARRAGISTGQVFYYFPAKEDLLRAVLDDGDDSAPFVRLYLVLVAESTRAEHPGNDYFRTRYERMRASLADAFGRLEREGLLALGVSPAHAAATTLALWDGVQLQRLLAPEAVDVVEQLRAHLATLTTPTAWA